MCTFFVTIGTIWGDAGLYNVLVESGVYAAATANQMLNGKQFHRAVRGLTLAYEAMMHVLMEEFIGASALQDEVTNLARKSIEILESAERDQSEALLSQLIEFCWQVKCGLFT